MGQQTQMSGGKTSSALPGQDANPPGTPVGAVSYTHLTLPTNREV